MPNLTYQCQLIVVLYVLILFSDPLNAHDAFMKKNSNRNCVNWGRSLCHFFLTKNFFRTGNHFNCTPPCFKSPLIICELIHDFYNLGDAVVERYAPLRLIIHSNTKPSFHFFRHLFY
ncbi:hypothetical protein T06_3306 [Trichinella sp. T6]|nr:hypothetical protein T06_3306 [Trichinella sp. T6]